MQLTPAGEEGRAGSQEPRPRGLLPWPFSGLSPSSWQEPEPPLGQTSCGRFRLACPEPQPGLNKHSGPVLPALALGKAQPGAERSPLERGGKEEWPSTPVEVGLACPGPPASSGTVRTVLWLQCPHLSNGPNHTPSEDRRGWEAPGTEPTGSGGEGLKGSPRTMVRLEARSCHFRASWSPHQR